MRPENHAIRQLEKQLEGASPDVANHIERVIASLNAVLLNEGDEAAQSLCRKYLKIEIEALEKALDWR